MNVQRCESMVTIGAHGEAQMLESLVTIVGTWCNWFGEGQMMPKLKGVHYIKHHFLEKLLKKDDIFKTTKMGSS